MKIIQKLKNLWMMLRTKKSLIKDFTHIQEELDNKLFDVMKDIEALDPDKVYYVYSPDTSFEDLAIAQLNFKKIQKMMKWTAPKVMFTNIEFKELKKKELENLIKKQFGS